MKLKQDIRICFISGVISRSGGTERVGTIVANALVDEGYNIFLLSFWNQGKPFFHLDRRVHLNYLLNPEKEGKLYRTYVYPIYKLHRFIRKNGIDIIVDIDTELAVFTSYAIQGTKCKQVSWEHFNYWSMQKLGEKRRFKAKKLIKKYASKLVVLTEEDRQKHLDVYCYEPDFVVTMPNPCISGIEYSYNFERKKFLFVGRLTPQKKISALLEAWNGVYPSCPDWELVIVGKGELEAELKSQAASLGLERIIFAGHTDFVGDYYRKAACFVLSSDYEGFPMVILEAQSYGLPVISFDCKTGPRDMIMDGVNGYLVEDKNIEELAKKMLLFTENQEKAERMSKAAYAVVQRFSLPSIVQMWNMLITDVLEGE